ncbi:hypothetical protein [Albimonas pacifica]|uniref:Uncharacterized protein n=1 Tax=Albimonas pacifica TaxID=1114924 RepID=A0A1I3GT97_9RHOB|nr:hypothetical protein [Albimonas pacifica]SFI26571.1 hypothetical protein SAMN05216258_105324 [Albimonas pacifica]
MARALLLTSVSLISATVPLWVASDDAEWTEVGRIGALNVWVAPDRYVFDEAAERLSVATRLDGDFDLMLSSVPGAEAEPPHLHSAGIRRMELAFVHDCRLGTVEEVQVHAGYDGEGRRVAVRPGLAALVAQSARADARAVSTPAVRDAIRQACRDRGAMRSA